MTTHPNRSQRKRKLGAAPSPEEIRTAREIAGLTQSQAAELIYATLRSWANYESDRTTTYWRPMRPADFELFLLKTGQLDIELVRAQYDALV